MKPRWRKVIADFWENKARSFLIIASISIGIFAVGVVGVGYLVIPDSMVTTYLSTNPANIQIRTDSFDEDLLKTIRKIPQVHKVAGRTTVTTKVQHPETGDWLSFNIIAVEDLSDQQLKILTPASGKPYPDRKEILITEDSLETLPIQPGSSIKIKLIDDTVQEFKVAGTVFDYSSDLAITFNERTGFINSESLGYLYTPRQFNNMVISVTGDQNDLNNIEAVAKLVTNEIEQSGRRILSQSVTRSNDQPYANYTDAIAIIIGFIGLFILVLSSALIINTMNALMAQHIRQIGVIKLVGGLRNQVIGMYLVLVIFFSIISLLIAIPASAYVGRLLCAKTLPVLNGKLLTTDTFIFLPIVVITQSIVAISIPILAALKPIIQGASVPIHKALTSNLINQVTKPSKFDQWLDNIRSKDGIITLGIRNTFRQKGRLFLTIFTLSLGCAIFISVFNVELSLNKQIERVLQFNQADIFLNLDRNYPSEEINIRLQAIPEVASSEAWLSTNALLKSSSKIDNVMLVAPPYESNLVKKVVNVGRWVKADERNTMAVNDAFWNTYPELKPGDQIVMEIAGKEEYWTVVGIFHYTGIDQKYAFTSFNNLANILKTPSHAFSYRVVTYKHDLAHQMKMANLIDEQLTSSGYKVISIIAREEIVRQGLEKIEVLIYVLLFLSVLTGIVGGIGLSGTLSLNVLERTAEIGILRAVGAYDSVISRLITFESLFIGLTSYVLGIIASFPISFVLTNLVNVAIFGARSEFVMTPKGVIIWFFILVPLSLIASYIPARNAVRLTIREVLAYE
ncbi:MAG TPA: FtsX-like permease family protein [Anaerolineaceae bacterium]|nr:FtsX-like permease family protein [Anaerolineaceae bacterium]